MKEKEEMTVRKICSILLSILLISISFVPVKADSNYRVVIEDNEDLLSSEEENRLQKKMEEILAYGNAGFVTVSQQRNTDAYAKSKYRELFGTDSGILFVIDMGRRNIWIYSDGAVYRTVNKAYANTIADNVYKYASNAKYYDCAYNVFDQANTLLEGGRIAQPMKYISNALIAFVVALLINFLILTIQRKPKIQIFDTVVPAMTTAAGINIINKSLTKKIVSTHVESSSYSSSGGGGYSSSGGGFSSGGSSSGGGSSGGGGGHSF